MKKSCVSFLFLIALSSVAQTPDTIKSWKKGGLIGLNFTQSSFTNWAAGG